MLGGVAVLAIIGIGLLIAPDDVGEGGIPPAVVDVVSEDQAIAALALYRAQAEAQESLSIDRSLYAPPGPSQLVGAAEAAAGAVHERLTAARGIPDADAAVRAYWEAGEHDAFLQVLQGSVEAIREINLLAAAHDSIYDGAGAIPLPDAEAELASRYLTGIEQADRPMTEWGHALLAALDGADDRERAETARAATDEWWQAHTGAALEPPATEALRAYLGGLPPSTLTGLEGHPVAGPGLQLLRGR